jgi:hypothetical protein
MIDGRLAALGGVTGTELSADGMLWLALTQEATRHPKAIVEEARRQLDGLMQVKRRLSAAVFSGDDAGLRLALALGFNIKHPLPFGSDDRTSLELCPSERQNRVLRKGAVAAPFIVYTAGRSRTAWLSEFLTYGKHVCHNEIAMKFRSMSEVGQFFSNPRVGTAETAAAPGWRLIKTLAPWSTAVVVTRDEDDIISSFATLFAANGIAFDEDKLVRVVRYEQRCLRQISAHADTLTVRFDDLDDESVCRAVFERCLPYEFDRGWWLRLSAENIQSPVQELVNYYRENTAGVEAFKRESRATMRRLVRINQLLGQERATDGVH